MKRFGMLNVMENFSGNALKITAIKKEDRGTYYCIAENGVGRGARRNINVEVEFKPFVTITKPVVYQVNNGPISLRT